MSDDLDRPWQERRGIETTDHNIGLVFARTGVEELARAIASRATSWERDVLGKRVRLAADFGWVFRIQGHSWAILLSDGDSAGSPAELSARLSAPVIAYDCSDTVESQGYVYAEGGKVRESLSFLQGEVEFSSELRTLEVKPAEAFRVADDFFRDHDVYEPGVYPKYFFGDGRTVPRLEAGKNYLVRNPGFVTCYPGGESTSIPPLERVDYLVFGAH
jgi:hypothetical protein